MNATIQKYNFTLSTFLVCAIAFFIPLYKPAVPILIILLSLNWIIDYNWKTKIELLKKRKILFLPILFFVAYLIGLIYSTNIEAGLKNIETKLSFLILPIVIGSSKTITPHYFKKIILSFLFGCLACVIFLICHAIYNYYNEIYLVKTKVLYDVYININYFFSGLLSYWHHPSYLSMYLVLAIAFVFYCINNGSVLNFTKRHLILLSFLIPVFIVFILLLASKIGMAAVVLLIVLEIAFLFWQTKRIKTGILVFVGLSVLSFFVVNSSPIIKSRFLYLFQPSTHSEDKHTTIESNASRFIAWECSYKLIMRSPLVGYGTGDGQEALVEEYHQSKYMGVYEAKLNSHNQFFQSTIAIGLPGFVILVLMFLTGLVKAINKKLRIVVIFFLLIIANILVESMFETEGGVVFFVFFFSVFFVTEFVQPKIKSVLI